MFQNPDVFFTLSSPKTLTDALCPKLNGLGDYKESHQDDRSDRQGTLPPFVEHHCVEDKYFGE